MFSLFLFFRRFRPSKRPFSLLLCADTRVCTAEALSLSGCSPGPVESCFTLLFFFMSEIFLIPPAGRHQSAPDVGRDQEESRDSLSLSLSLSSSHHLLGLTSFFHPIRPQPRAQHGARVGLHRRLLRTPSATRTPAAAPRRTRVGGRAGARLRASRLGRQGGRGGRRRSHCRAGRRRVGYGGGWKGRRSLTAAVLRGGSLCRVMLPCSSTAIRQERERRGPGHRSVAVSGLASAVGVLMLVELFFRRYCTPREPGDRLRASCALSGRDEGVLCSRSSVLGGIVPLAGCSHDTTRGMLPSFFSCAYIRSNLRLLLLPPCVWGARVWYTVYGPSFGFPLRGLLTGALVVFSGGFLRRPRPGRRQLVEGCGGLERVRGSRGQAAAGATKVSGCRERSSFLCWHARS